MRWMDPQEELDGESIGMMVFRPMPPGIPPIVLVFEMEATSDEALVWLQQQEFIHEPIVRVPNCDVEACGCCFMTESENLWITVGDWQSLMFALINAMVTHNLLIHGNEAIHKFLHGPDNN